MRGDVLGTWNWKRFSEEQPKDNLYIYVYYNSILSVGKVSEYTQKALNECYWCYVYMPDAPKIEKKLTLEDRLECLEKIVNEIKELVEELVS